MKFAALIPLVGCVWNSLLACFVLWHGHRERSHQVYFFLGMAIAIWNLGGYYLLGGYAIPNGVFWARFLFMGVIFIPVLLYHLSLIIAQVQPGKLLKVGYALTAVVAVTNFTPFFIERVRSLPGAGLYAVPGPAFPAFHVVFSLVFISIYTLVRQRKRLSRLQHTRLNALIFAQVCLIILGTNDLLPLNKIDYYPGTKLVVYPYGSLAAVLYGIILAYSVLQHQLLNVRIHISRIAAQSIRFAFLFCIGLLLLLIVAMIAPDEFGTVSFLTTLGVLMASGIIASILFPRLFGAGAETLERRILGDRFEYQDQVRSFIDTMTWYGDLNSLLNDLHELFTGVFRLASYQIILRDETTRAFTVFRAFPEQQQKQLSELRVPSPVFQYFEWGKGEYLSLDRRYSMPSESPIVRQAREQLDIFDADFCFPLASQNEPFGLLVVGRKKDGEPYTATDINLFVALVKSMSLMVNQIRLKNQILQAQELDLLGRMSRGMAHDLNNLLTPVWTLLQLSNEGVTPQALDEELLPVALRNLGTMRAYIKEALFFSENLRPDFQLGRLDMLVAQAVEVAKNSRNKPIQINTDTPGEVLVEMDEVLIQRLIANVIANAIDASAPDSEVRVELQRLAKTEASRDWLRVRIIDQGEGIKKEDLNRVFTPYYTTKNRGDETRGFGLGLAICRKIVNLHGGNLSITSQLKKGTTVQVDLPSRQVKPITPPATVQT